MADRSLQQARENLGAGSRDVRKIRHRKIAVLERSRRQIGADKTGAGKRHLQERGAAQVGACAVRSTEIHAGQFVARQLTGTDQRGVLRLVCQHRLITHDAPRGTASRAVRT